MQILHLFDRYLNGTMNWAFQLLQHSHGVQHQIAAPIFVDNSFMVKAFDFWPSPYQKTIPENEWQIPTGQLSAARIGMISGHYQRFLIQQIHKKKPDLMHAHFAGMGWHALKPARKTNLPLLVSFYGYDYEQLPFRKPVYKKRYLQLFKEAAGFITEGEHGASILQKMGCPKEKIFVIPLGVQVQKIPFFKRAKTPGQLKMIQAATFTQKKGQLFAIQALEAALRDCPGIHLTLLGEGQNQSLLKELKEYVKVRALSSNVTFQDFVSPAEFHEYLQQFDLFIHPSCYADDLDCEGGAPIVLLDAQASGMPIISTRHCDIPSEVLHMKTGWLSAEKDVADLAEGIKFFYQMNGRIFNQFSQAARAHVEENFAVQNSGRNLTKLYHRITRS